MKYQLHEKVVNVKLYMHSLPDEKSIGMIFILKRKTTEGIMETYITK
jgi:hypothetical protein